ncbi:uncharacterized protein FTJAE_10571 [Fusarium tjaetaba]|uniref:Uncharacterized protein n=1 Tax=Fusarium tjaetaba TaxID=1567544 RepID=A0A8H5VHG6_9HYPO|nr:uncharacterized protein FTJAE_10571 [Fusarium tjaetaba]KAF5623626.1 hypothetical protein FTJAE_10571 [Fusarium tjaetaba]
MDIDPNSPSPGPGPQSQADFLWDSLIETFPFLTDQAHRALNIQLEFFRNMSTRNLPIPQDANAKEKLKVILAKAQVVNKIVASLIHSSELLIELKEIDYDEVINVRRAEVSNMVSEASVNIQTVIAMQTDEVRIGLGQQGAAEVQEQQRHAEQEEMFMQQRNGGLGMGASESPESRIPFQGFAMPLYHQPYLKDTTQYHLITQVQYTLSLQLIPRLPSQARHQGMVTSQHSIKRQHILIIRSLVRYQGMVNLRHTPKPQHILTIQSIAHSQHIPSPKQSPYKDKTAYTPIQAPRALTTLRFE